MSVSLRDLRLYATEVAGKDLSSEKGDRLAMHWINGALARINGAHMWSWYKRSHRITLVAAELGVLLVVTAGSRVVSIATAPIAVPPDPQIPEEVFKQKWLDERWHFLIDDDSRTTYELGEISDPKNAKFLPGYEWVQASSSPTVPYTVARHIFPLPEHKRIMLVEDTFNSTDLLEMLPSGFDKLRQTSPIYRGQPTHYTIREGHLELWPPSSDDDRILFVSYHAAAPRYGLAAIDDGDQLVDWESKWTDLLNKGILVEAALTQGKRAPVPYGVAKKEFDDRLMQCKQDDSNVTAISGTVESAHGRVGGYRTRVRDYPNDLQTWRGS